VSDPAASTFPRVQRGWIVAAGILVAAVTAVLFWRQRPLSEVPPLPAAINDEEVRELLERQQAKVVEDPGSAEAWGELGLALLANLFDRDADVCLAEAARLDPLDIRWPFIRGVIATKRNPDQSIALLRQAAALNRPGPKHRSAARLFLAEALLEQRELDEAEAIFREELANSASRPRATLGLGLVARARGDDAAATELLTLALDHPSSRIQATIQLAALARARGDVAEAAGLEKEAAALPDDRAWPDPTLEELSKYKVGRRSQERAIGEFEQNRQFDEAARAYLRQIDEQPTVEAYIGAAVNLARLQDYERANQLLEQAVQLDPESSKAHYTLALVNFTRAEKESAADPGSDAAREWFQAAVRSGQRATELKPDHAQAYLMWGLALQHLGEPAAAIEPLRKGVACRPDLFALQLGLGQALLEAGHEREAQQALENARRLNPDDPRPARALEGLRKQ
jgi:tetratricopeptide (TPR) repeat protein